MIKITLKSGTYTKKQLDDVLSKTFDTQRDIDLFIEAIVDTGQVIKKQNNYVFPQAEKVTHKYPSYYKLSTYYYGGRDRVGVRGGTEWVEKHGYPSNMYLSKIKIGDKWVNIKEKPSLDLVKGRGYKSKQTLEKWRAQIPVEIQRKYNITPDTQISVAVTQQTFNYYANPQIWGYRYRVMLAYGETKNGANPRSLEIEGHSFVAKIKKDISDSIEKHQRNIKQTMLRLLEKGDPEYYGLYAESDNAGTIGENIQIEPLMNRSRYVPIVELSDLENNRIIIDWNTLQEKQSIPSPNEFQTNLHIDQGLAMTRGQTKLEMKWKNRGGFK